MRQLTSGLMILIVVATIAAFTVVSIFTVIHASSVLQMSIGDADNLAYAESMDECELFDASTCL
jgi:hypothetical protein